MKILIVNKYTYWRTFEKGISIDTVSLKRNSKRIGIWFYTVDDIPLFPKNIRSLENLQKSKKRV